jgi:hypothetical protein
MPDLNSIENALAPLGYNKARLKCLAAVLVALLTIQSVNLKKLANLLPTNALPDSAYKRLQRLLRFFEPDQNSLARTLAAICKVAPPWNLSMDRTNWKLGKLHLNVLMLAVVAGPISFPLMWTVLERDGEGKAGNSHTGERVALMTRFVRLFAKASCACLRADREFASVEFLAWLEGAGISYQLRLKGDTLVADARGKPCPAYLLFANCPVQKERILGFRMVLGRRRFVCGTRLLDGDYLILASDAECPLAEYALRWGIEPMFGSLKSRGFDLEATHVTDPVRLSRLLCVLSLAYCWAGSCGLWLFEERGLKLRRHGRMPVSAFRLGLDFLQPIMAKLCRTVSDCQAATAIRFLSCT